MNDFKIEKKKPLVPTFQEYAEMWLAIPHYTPTGDPWKESTLESYKFNLEKHVYPAVLDAFSSFVVLAILLSLDWKVFVLSALTKLTNITFLALIYYTFTILDKINIHNHLSLFSSFEY